MFQKTRSQLGSAGLAIAVLALVVALAGTALAAKGVFTKKQEKQIVKIAKKYAGKAGKDGAVGPAGQVGAKGDAGPRGPEGPQGEPGVTGFTATLPSEESLYGDWAIGGTEVEGVAVGFISFGIPLEESPDAVFVPVGVDKSGEGCSGTAAAPSASPGTLCIYAKEFVGTFNTAEPNEQGAVYSVLAEPIVFGTGTWAVTAP